MTANDFDLYLSGTIGICAVMAAIMAFRYRSRGNAAFVMSAAFLAFGAVLYMLKVNAPRPWIFAGTVVVGLLLVADFMIRAAAQHKEPPK